MAALETSRIDEAFSLLNHPYRRCVLYYLTTESEAVDVYTLATAITERDGNHLQMNRSNDSKDIEIALHHIHLPKLAGAGIITFDVNMGRVELRELGILDRVLVETAPIDGYTHGATGD